MNTLLAIYQNFRIQDLFDILIIATMIYLLIVWLKNTASRQVFMGIIVLGALYLLARIFHLYLTTMILQAFFAILLLILVIIFQEEIRRFLERLADIGSLRRTLSGAEETPDLITTLVESVDNLSACSCGALIVLPGRDPLMRHLKGGYELQGRLSAPLLASIFDNHSPGHDGAILVENARITRFGVHLPLCLDAKRCGRLGLRHTAAMGLTERTDALCIVISEERGSIAVARHGELTNISSPSELSATLQDHLAAQTTDRLHEPVSHWARRNTGAKVAAIMLAFFLWLMFGYQEGELQRDMSVPLEYRMATTEWELEEALPNEIVATISGSRQAFNVFDPSRLAVSVDLSDIQEGSQDIILTHDMIRLPSNLGLVHFAPEQLSITAHRLRPVNVPVEVVTSGMLPAHLTLDSIEVTPHVIGILAPGEESSAGLLLRTAPLDLGTITASGIHSLEIPLPPGVRLKEGQDASVRVTVNVREVLPDQS